MDIQEVKRQMKARVQEATREFYIGWCEGESDAVAITSTPISEEEIRLTVLEGISAFCTTEYRLANLEITREDDNENRT